MNRAVWKFKRNLVSLTIVFLGFSSAADAATINVPGDQSSIPAAVAAAAPGDVILVAPGTYNVKGITISKANITVASKFHTTGDSSYVNQTILNGGDATIFTTSEGTSAGFTLVGFKIINSYKPVIINDRASIKYNYFYDNNSDNISFEAGGYGYVGYNRIELAGDDGIDSDSRNPGGHLTIEHNIVKNSGDDGIEIRLYGFTGAQKIYDIHDNEFSGNEEDGIQLIDYSDISNRVFNIYRNVLANNSDAGLGCMPDGDTIENLNGAPLKERVNFYNNTVVGNRVGLTGGDNMIAINNIIANNSVAGAKFVDSGSVIAHSIFHNNNNAHLVSSVSGAGNILNVDPLYDAFNYTLKAGSPAIDKGVASFAFNGQTLSVSPYNGGAPDLGAKEAGSGGAPTNQAPIVDAGEPLVTTSGSATLMGSVRDDGLPSGSTLQSQWSKIEGPGTVVFDAPSSAQTMASFSVEGQYRLRLMASDGAFAASDDAIVRYTSGGSGAVATVSVSSPTYIEAESFAYIYGSAMVASDPAASGGKIVQAPVGQGLHAFTEHRINLSAADAVYYVFIRARSGSSTSGALDVTVKDGSPVRLAIANNTYGWIKMPSGISLSAGNWPVIVKAASEGVVWDQIAISTSSSFVPSSVSPTPTPVPTATPTSTPPPTPTPLPGSSLTLKAVADAYVDSGKASTNFGSSTRLMVDTSPTQQAYVKFVVPALSAPIVSAKLRIYVTNSSSNSPKAVLVGSEWSESGLTYNNRPSSLSSTLEDKGATSTGWVEYNVTAAVKASGTFSFALLPTSSDGMDLHSREGSNPPQLVITVGSSSPSATPTPAPTPVVAPTATPMPTPAATATPSASIVDDTHASLSLAGPTLTATGSIGYTRYSKSNLAANTKVDARTAVFTLANSKNSNPTASQTCESGSLPTNPYPVMFQSSPGIKVVGGLVKGEVSLTSDWEPSYCNSAAIGVWKSNDAVVDGIRIDRAWDAVRFSDGSNNFLLKNAWLSNVRDDVLENDQLKTGTIQDILVDGAFNGISVDPSTGSSTLDSPQEVVSVKGVLMRMKPFLFRGEVTHYAPFKTEERTSSFSIEDSVFALESPNMKGLERLQRAWSRTKSCRNNVLLWLSDAAMPTAFPMPPSCFQIIKGQAARDFWQRARKNWIDCHPKVARLSTDPVSVPSQCDASFFGGKN